MKLWILLFIISFHANALTGIWYGQGELKNPRRQIPCEIFMDLSMNQQEFAIVGGGYICDDYNVEYPASQFEIVDSKLYYNGVHTGDVIEGGVRIFSEFEPGLWFYLTLVITDKGLTYDERWEVEGSELYVYSNSLQKQSTDR